MADTQMINSDSGHDLQQVDNNVVSTSYHIDEYLRTYHRALEYRPSNDESSPNLTEDNRGSLADDIILTLAEQISRRTLHRVFETETSLSGGGLSEEKMSKYLKTRSTCADEEQSEIICVVCQDQLYQEKTIRTIATLEYCGHEYHVDCIKQWLRQKNLCPLCKAKATGDEDDR
ncbi:hypothetical protein DH2020_046336 [Rehmannia glutinosa]|uniref:RING-type E3 ubiquitin transferase n=1 Tax=Rehmannia glutinosa TaxID=99300 RepID=A0ABR0UC65_REHGL